MTEKGITKAQLEKRATGLEKAIEVLEDENYAYRQAIKPLIPIARTMVEIHEHRRTKPEAGIDIGVRFDTLQRIAALELGAAE